MKKILVLLGFVLLVNGCKEGAMWLLFDIATDQIYQDPFEDMKEDMNRTDILYFMKDHDLNNKNEIINWITYNIKYVDQGDYYGFESGVQNPYTTFYLRKGNCEAITCLAMEMLKNIEVNIKIIAVNIIKTNTDHAIIFIDGEYYDFQKHCYVNNELITGVYKYLYEVTWFNYF